jgi:hypothetical protein
MRLNAQLFFGLQQLKKKIHYEIITHNYHRFGNNSAGCHVVHAV